MRHTKKTSWSCLFFAASVVTVAVHSPVAVLAQDNAASAAKSGKATDVAKFDHPDFEPPVRLTVDGTPLNVKAKQMYPSPAMFDIDADGKVELVVGDIFGSIKVYENKNQASGGDPIWSPHVALNSADGKAIKVSNW